MNKSARAVILGLFVAAATAAATSRSSSHLTLRRVLELTAPTNVPAAVSYRVDISELGQTVLPAAKPEGQIALTRELISPTDFDPPQPSRLGDQPAVLPSTPTNFEKFNVGWTVRLSAKPFGKLVAVSGAADYVEASLVPGGYGAVAGPIYADQTEAVITPNVMNTAKVQTTATRFQLFAVPGTTYEVTFYRGAKAETHRIRVSAE